VPGSPLVVPGSCPLRGSEYGVTIFATCPVRFSFYGFNFFNRSERLFRVVRASRSNIFCHLSMAAKAASRSAVDLVAAPMAAF
jgi:hypothetical protein